jgi:galactokinase
MPEAIPSDIKTILSEAASQGGLDVSGGRVRRSSSRFCLGVEHGDYNGTELFGVGTDRFIWLAYKLNDSGRVRLFSANFPEDGVIDFPIGEPPAPGTTADSWARFPYGVCHVLRQEGYPITKGFDAVLYGNIPGGGMSRSASLALNLILTFLDASGIGVSGIGGTEGMRVVELAKSVENDYIGSPCGNLDQIMIYFAKAGMGTHFSPVDGSIKHVPLPAGTDDFRLVSLDTGTVRPGLEKSTYKTRRAECDELAAMCYERFGIRLLGDVKTPEQYDAIRAAFNGDAPQLFKRLKYIYEAQQRFAQMLDAWRAGDLRTVGNVFRQDGYGLRDDYQISGPELETMCDLARTVDGVLGERMLGGGDKGASGAIVLPEAVEELRAVIDREYPQRCPDYAGKYAVHACGIVDGIADCEGW